MAKPATETRGVIQMYFKSLATADIEMADQDAFINEYQKSPGSSNKTARV